MSRFLLVTWAGGGNVAPMLVLAHELARRGHDVDAIAPETLRSRVDAAGATIVHAPDDWLARADEVLGAVAATDPDVVLVDYMLTGALVGAERSGRPTVALVHTLYGALLVDGAPHPIGMAGSVEDVNAWRRAVGLEPIERHADLLAACALVLVAAPEALDVAATTTARVRYTGPLVEPATGAWTPPTGDGPLVVVSMGTAGEPERDADATARVIAALAPLPVRAVVTLPDYLAPAQVGSAPNVVVGGFVPHALVLPHADLVITHAGLGTIGAALVHGTRLLCLPFDRDQPDNARAVVRIEAGSMLAADATVEEIRRAVEHELMQPPRDPLPSEPAPAIERVEALVVTGSV